MYFTINPFLRIIFTDGSIVIINSYRDKEFVADSGLLNVLSRLSDEQYFLIERLHAIFQSIYGELDDMNSVISHFIESEIIVNKDSEIESSYIDYGLWFQYGWGDALHYLLSTKNYPFIQYEKASGFLEDSTMMKEYLSQDSFYPYKNDVPNPLSKKFGDTISWPKKQYSDFCDPKKSHVADNIDDYNEHDKIGVILKAAFGVISENSFGHGKFPKKIPPSGGSRHPSSGYLCDIQGTFGKGGTTYLYQQYLHSLHPIVENSNLSEMINEGCYNFLHHSQFPAKYTIFITSDFVKSMWRYRESRSYRVLYNDCGHIIRVLTSMLKLMNFKFQEFSFIDEDRIAELLQLELSEQKCERPIYGIFIG